MKSRIEILIDGVHFPHKRFTFPGGEIQVRIDTTISPPLVDEEVIFYAYIFDSEGLIELLLLADAFEQHYGKGYITLVIPYFPYARQDRICSPGEAFSYKVIYDLLTPLFKKIYTYDLHNSNPEIVDYSKTDFVIVDAVAFVEELNLQNRYDFVVAPDKGAKNRAQEVAELLKIPVITAQKVRNPDTGQITHTEIIPEHKVNYNSKFLIVDDICDGGRTFIELAKVIHETLEPNSVDLYVTHGIFSKGYSVFAGLINKVYTANLFPNEDPEVEKNVIVWKKGK